MDENITSVNSLKSVLDTVLSVYVPQPPRSQVNLLLEVTKSWLAIQTDGQCLHHDRVYPEKEIAWITFCRVITN